MNKLANKTYIKVITGLLTAALVVLSFAGCEKEVITLADDINAAGGETEYIEIKSFELKKPADKSRSEIGYVALFIPDDYTVSDDNPNMYISSLYPLDASNIYYTRANSEDIGAVDDKLTADSYKEAVESEYEKSGERIDLNIDAFDKEEMDGIPCYKVRSHYTFEDRQIEMLAYIILASDTYVITYTQVSDDELMADFLTDEGSLKLVKEVSGKR